MRMKKIVLLIILIAIAVFLLNAFGYIGITGNNVTGLDEKYNLGEEKIVPGTQEELISYETELNSLNESGAKAKVVKLKLALVEMQKNLILLSEQTSQIDVQNPNCTFKGPVFKAKDAIKETEISIANALEIQKGLAEITGFEYLSDSSFVISINNIKSTIGQDKQLLNSLC